MKKIGLLLGLLFIISACGNIESVYITYETNGGGIAMMNPDDTQTQTVSGNFDLFIPKTPYKANHLFENWYIDQGLTTLYTHEALSGKDDITLYAKYVPHDNEVHTVIVFISNGGTFTPNQFVVLGNTLTEPSDPSKEGYTFTHWEAIPLDADISGPIDWEAPVMGGFLAEAQYTKD